MEIPASLRLPCLFLLAAFTGLSGTASSQTVKPATGTKPTLGTAQLPGDNGKLGTIYQLGDKGTELHFTLDSASIVTRYKALDSNILAGKSERLLLLSFTVHNPLKMEQSADARTFKFTVVSPDDKNVEFRGAVYEPVKRTSISQLLKPAQKVKLDAVIPIFAEGPVTKLMVARGAGKILRYDLREGLKKTDSVFSADGISIGDTANVELAKPFEFCGFDFEVQEVKEATEPIGAYIPSGSSGVYYATVKFSNPLAKTLSVGWQYFTPELTDENGEKIHWPSDMVSVSSGKTFSQDIDADGSVRARYMFTGAKGLKLAKFKLINNSTGRAISVKLS
jgi:hypothetical protein